MANTNYPDWPARSGISSRVSSHNTRCRPESHTRCSFAQPHPLSSTLPAENP